MCTRGECQRSMGKWVEFHTIQGYHRGVVERVTNESALVRVPRRYAPVGLVAFEDNDRQTDAQKLDIALAQYGYRGYNRYGYGYWGGGWWWWWLPFALIFWLAFLW